MARIDNLTNFATDIANAIRIKSGKTDLISPSNFDTEIINLPSGSIIEPNIFIQEDEPTIKEGLWIKASNIQVDKIVIDENVFVTETWMDPTLIGKVHSGTNNYAMSCAVVGEYLYLSGSVQANTPMYKVNLKDYSIENLGNPPYILSGKTSVVIGTDIYYVGNRTGFQISSRDYLIKFDTISNTYTKLADLPYSIHSCSRCFLYNNCIYVFFMTTPSDITGYYGYSACAKYDVATDTWSDLPFYPKFYPSYCDIVVLGDKAWFLFNADYSSATSSTVSYTSYKKTFVFNLTTEEYEETNLEFTTNSGTSEGTRPRCFVKDNYLYLLTITGIRKIPTSEFVIGDSLRKLDLSNYELIEYLDYNNDGVKELNTTYLQRLNFTQNNNMIYISGMYSNADYDVLTLPFTTKEFDNNTLVIRQGISNSSAVLTQLFNMPLQKGRLTYPLYNTIHYTSENGANNSLPLYYGTGTEWVRFRN